MESRKPPTAKARRATGKHKLAVSIDLDRLESLYRRGSALRQMGESDKKKRTRDDGDG